MFVIKLQKRRQYPIQERFIGNILAEAIGADISKLDILLTEILNGSEKDVKFKFYIFLEKLTHLNLLSYQDNIEEIRLVLFFTIKLERQVSISEKTRKIFKRQESKGLKNLIAFEKEKFKQTADAEGLLFSSDLRLEFLVWHSTLAWQERAFLFHGSIYYFLEDYAKAKEILKEIIDPFKKNSLIRRKIEILTLLYLASINRKLGLVEDSEICMTKVSKLLEDIFNTKKLSLVSQEITHILNLLPGRLTETQEWQIFKVTCCTYLKEIPAEIIELEFLKNK